MSAAKLLEPFPAQSGFGCRGVPTVLWDCPPPVDFNVADLPERFAAQAGGGDADCEGIVRHYESRLNAANGVLLHCGAGRGELMETLRRHGFAVMGCEPSARRVALAQQAYGFDARTLHCGHAEDFLRWVKRIGQPAQALFYRHDLEHSLELHALLRRMAEVLCANGLLIALLPPPHRDHSRAAHLSFLNELAIGCAAGEGHFEVAGVDCDFQNRFMGFVLKKTAVLPRDAVRHAAAFGPAEIFLP